MLKDITKDRLDFKKKSVIISVRVMLYKDNIMNNTSESSGRSMVEMLGVLAIVGVLSVGGIIGYITASHNLRTNNLKDEISTIVANIRTLFFTAENYENLSEITLINAGLVPDWMVTEDKLHIQNKAKGSVFVGPSDHWYKKDGGFILVFNGLDAKTCRELAISDWGSDMASGFIALSVKNDGDLTVETSNLTDAFVQKSDTVILSEDLASGTLQQIGDLCNCITFDTCAIAWKFQ